MPNRAATIHRIFLLAIERDGADREACLREQCGDDAALRAEIEALLGHDHADRFLAETGLLGMRRALGDGPPLPERIGAFRILAELGRGGMGVVYRARQDQPDREVALKVLAPGLGGREARARFAFEAEALGRLQHPGIAQIHEAGTYRAPDGDRPYLAMELVRGEPLHTFVRQRAPSLPQRLDLWLQVCDAVHHAHQKGLIHRDLKPGNVLVDAAGRCKVLDFGIARLVEADRSATLRTRTGELLGTLAYMSPEQANGTDALVDVRADVYSLGAIGYELLGGVPPLAVAGESLTQSLRRIVEQEPPPLGQHDRRLRGDLQTIVAKALRKEPERRYASAQALADDVRRHLAHEPIEARPATALYVVQRFARRHRSLVAGAALAATALVAGTFASVRWAMRAEQAEAVAQAEKGAAIRAAERAERAEVAAREEARVANRVTELLRALLRGASPEHAPGRDPTARELLAAGRTAIDRERDADPPAAARVSLILGEVFVALGDVATGEAYTREALAALRGAVAGDDARLVEALHVHAWALVRAQRHAEAGPLYAEALAMHRRLGQASDTTVAKCLEGMAQVAARTGDRTRALELLAEARPLRERVGDPVRLAWHWQNVATTHLLAGSHDEADAAFAHARTILPVAGNEAFAALLAGNLGNLRLRQGRLEDAEEEFRLALACSETAFGPNSPRLMLALSQLGSICGQTGRLDEAAPLLQRALALGGDDTKSNDRTLGDVLTNLGMVAAEQGDLAAAVGWWGRAEAMETRLRPGSSHHVQVLQCLAEGCQQLGDGERAKGYRERAAAVRKPGK